MKSITLRAWTRGLFIVLLCACMLVQLGCAQVQALSFVGGVKQEGSPYYMEEESKHKEVEAQEVLAGLKDTIATGIIGSVSMLKKTGLVPNTSNQSEIMDGELTLLSEDEEDEAKEDTGNSSAILMFTGDLMCLGGQQNAVNKKGSFDFTNSFSYVAPLFEGADLLVGNLETLISPSNSYTYQEKTKNNNPNCNAMESYLEALVYAGFDALVTANNHSLDGHIIGIKETIEHLQEYQFLHTGTFLNEKEEQYILYEVNDISIAILSYTELINARSTLAKKQVESHISCYSESKVIKDVQAAKEAGADYIVAYNHWGQENTHQVSKLQKQHALEMANAGVDLILGSHPHCLQEAVYITAKDGRQVLCVYSMGNFVSSMTREMNNDTIVLEVNLRRREEQVYPGAIGYYPMKVIGNYKKQPYVIVPVSSRLNGNSKLGSTLEEARVRIREVIGNEISEIR